MGASAARYWKFVFVTGHTTTGKFDLAEFQLWDIDDTAMISTPLTSLTPRNDAKFAYTADSVQYLTDGDNGTGMEITVAAHDASDYFHLTWDAGVEVRPYKVSVRPTSVYSLTPTLRVLISDDGVTWTRYSDRYRIFWRGINQTGTKTLKSYDPYFHGVQHSYSHSGAIFGIVSEDSVIKGNTPVFLVEREGFKTIQRDVTDEFGGFSFYGLDEALEYYVFAVDDDGAIVKNAEGKDHIVPVRATIQLENNVGHQALAQRIPGFIGNCYPQPTINGSTGYGMTSSAAYVTSDRADFAYQNSWATATDRDLMPGTPPQVVGANFRSGHVFTTIDGGVANAVTLEAVVAAPSNGYTHIWGIGKAATDHGGYGDSQHISRNTTWGGYSSGSDYWEEIKAAFIVSINSAGAIIVYPYGSYSTGYSITAQLPDNDFHHIMLCITGGDTVELWLDGIQASTKSLLLGGNLKLQMTLDPPRAEIDKLWMGPSDVQHYEHMDDNSRMHNTTGDAHIAYLSLYRRHLSTAELAELYAGFFNPPEYLISGHNGVVATLNPSMSIALDGPDEVTQPPLFCDQSEHAANHASFGSYYGHGVNASYQSVIGKYTGMTFVNGYYVRQLGGAAGFSGQGSIRIVFQLDLMPSTVTGLLEGYTASRYDAYYYDYDWSTQVTRGYELLIDSTGNLRYRYHYADILGTKDLTITLSPPLPTATLLDLVLTHDPYSGQVQVFVDGILRGTAQEAFLESYPDVASMRFGYNSGVTSDNLSGFIARVDIFPRILTTAEMLTLYEN